VLQRANTKQRYEIGVNNTDKVCLSLTRQRAAYETWNAHPFYWQSVHLGPNFTITGSSPAKMSISLIALQLCRWTFLDN